MEQIKEILMRSVAGVPYWAIAVAAVAVAYVGGFIGGKKKKFRF